MYKNSARFQKWSKMLEKDSRAHEEARDARIDQSPRHYQKPATPGEEFRRTFKKLQTAIRFLQSKLDEIASAPGWERLVRSANEIWAHWSHLAVEDSQPHPSYDDYVVVQRVSDDLGGVIEAICDQEVAVIVAMIELRELREKYREAKPEDSLVNAEQRAEKLLAICEQVKDQIKAADSSLEYLLFYVPAFDAYYERYSNKAEDQS